jgi:23S rRNA (uracil1939-C5)-methyltransferase
VLSCAIAAPAPLCFSCHTLITEDSSQPIAKTEVELDIDRLSYGPYGIGRSDGKAVMIPSSAPGDRVVARLIESKARYAIGAIVNIVAPSPLRQTPPCPYVGDCGGCTWQHIRYREQLKAKEQSVADALRRIGKLDNFALRPIVASPRAEHYRRRIRLQVSAVNRLGFYSAASHHVVEVDACLIAAQPLNAVIAPLRLWLDSLAANLEHIEIISGDEPGQTVVSATAAEPLVASDEQRCEQLLGATDSIDGVIVHAGDWRRTWGNPSITVVLQDDLTLKLDADTFTQVNAEANRLMLAELLNAGAFDKQDRVLELYSGAGNFTLPMARQAGEITAVEGFRSAVASGKLNGQRNGIDNIHWICAPVPRALAQLKQQRQKYSKVVLNPPRTGAKGIEAAISALGAATIMYISCNPTTLARDLAALSKLGYKLRFVQPVDFFPHTFHVESLAVMTR